MATSMTDYLQIRVTPADIADVESVERRVPSFTRSRIARAAYRLGIKQLKANPKLLLEDVEILPEPAESAPEPAPPSAKGKR